MSYIYSQALVEAYLPDNYSDTDASVQSNVNHTHKPCLWHDKTMEHSRLSRFGMTCKPLTESHGEELLMSFVAGFRVKTSAQPEKAQELKEKEADCGQNKNASFAILIRGTHTWKTAKCSLLGDSEEFLQPWPKWGLMQNGACYRLEKQGLAMNVSESGYWLPTPTAHNAKEWNYPSERTRNTPTLAAVLGGKINPEFTEWMMGWPIGHTDLKPLETVKYQEWQQQHSTS